jgi:hypothetical protein
MQLHVLVPTHFSHCASMACSFFLSKTQALLFLARQLCQRLFVEFQFLQLGPHRESVCTGIRHGSKGLHNAVHYNHAKALAAQSQRARVVQFGHAVGLGKDGIRNVVRQERNTGRCRRRIIIVFVGGSCCVLFLWIVQCHGPRVHGVRIAHGKTDNFVALGQQLRLHGSIGGIVLMRAHAGKGGRYGKDHHGPRVQRARSTRLDCPRPGWNQYHCKCTMVEPFAD